MRTDEEIVARIWEIQKDDFFGFETSDLLVRLPFDSAKEFLKPEATAEKWEVTPRDREYMLKEMQDYMPFAWGKANNCRSISASRSMSHYSAWTWLAGDDVGGLQDYEFYGKDNLVNICKRYGWDSSKWDDGRRVNSDDE